MVILVDTSAWIEFTRATESRAHLRLRALIEGEGDEVVTTEVVYMELLAGARDERRASDLRRVLDQFELVPIEGLADYEQAALIFRTCRRYGTTVRTRFDCLIAAVAMRVDAAVLHHGRDFEAIARHAPLRLAG